MKEATSASTEHELSWVTDQVPLSMKAILSACTSPDKEYAQGLSHQEDNVLVHIAGYIVRKVERKVWSVCLKE